MNRTTKTIAAIIATIVGIAVTLYFLSKKNKGESISLESIKQDLNTLVGKKETPKTTAATAPTQIEQGKTVVEQTNNEGKLLITAVTAGGVGTLMGVTAIRGLTATAGLTAALKVAGKTASKVVLPLTAALAIWDTKTLIDKRATQGSLSLGEIAGQYTGLGGLGITGTLPQGLQSLLGMRI